MSSKNNIRNFQDVILECHLLVSSDKSLKDKEMTHEISINDVVADIQAIDKEQRLKSITAVELERIKKAVNSPDLTEVIEACKIIVPLLQSLHGENLYSVWKVGEREANLRAVLSLFLHYKKERHFYYPVDGLYWDTEKNTLASTNEYREYILRSL